MTTIRLKRNPHTGDFEALRGCAGCQGCVPQYRTIRLNEKADEIELSMAQSVQFRVLWNSFGKPLAATLLFAFIAQAFAMNDGASLLMALAGFTVGYFGCESVPDSELSYRKIGENTC